MKLGLNYINGGYTTVQKNKVFFPSLIFYKKLIPIILNASKKAKKHNYSYEEWVESSLNVIRSLEESGVEFHIDGIDNINLLQKNPAVVIANHMSTLETFILAGILYPHLRITFVVKKQLTEIPIFKHIMISTNPIAVTRKNPREDLKMVLEEGTKRLSDGYSVIIFPQTTRLYEFDVKEFNSIGIKLAKKANVPIIPLALKTDAWQQGKLIKDFGKIDPSKKVYFYFGKPIHIKGLGQEEHKEVIKYITKHLIKLNVPVKNLNE